MTQPGILPQVPSPRFPKATLLRALREASGVQVIWYTDRRQAFNQQSTEEKSRIIVRLVAYTSIFVDEKRLAFNEAMQRNDSIVCARRGFTLGIKAQSLDPKLEAFDLLERVRARFRTERILAMLRPTIALQDFKPIVPIEAFADGHALLTANMDVRLHCVLTFVNQDPYEGDWIEYEGDNFGQVLVPGVGTVSVTAGSASVTFAVVQSLPAGTGLLFLAQPGVYYTLASTITGATSATLTTAYTGPTSSTSSWNSGAGITGTLLG